MRRGFVRTVLSALRENRRDRRMLALSGDVWVRVVESIYTQAEDEAVVHTLVKIVSEQPAQAQHALAYFEERRRENYNYETDRACRLLRAATRGEPVAPIADADRDRFEEERRLGWLPLDEAFRELVHRVPALEQLEDDVRRLARDPDSSYQLVDRQLAELVGLKAPTGDVVSKSTVAYQVAVRYLDAVAGRPSAGDVRKSLWSGQFKAPK